MATKSDLYAGLTNAYRTRHYIVFQEIGLCDARSSATRITSAGSGNVRTWTGSAFR